MSVPRKQVICTRTKLRQSRRAAQGARCGRLAFLRLAVMCNGSHVFCLTSARAMLEAARCDAAHARNAPGSCLPEQDTVHIMRRDRWVTVAERRAGKCARVRSDSPSESPHESAGRPSGSARQHHCHVNSSVDPGSVAGRTAPRHGACGLLHDPPAARDNGLLQGLSDKT